MRYILHICLLMGSILPAKAQLSPDPSTHSRQPAADSARIRLLLEQSVYYLNKPGDYPGDFDSAHLLARQAAQLSRQTGNAGGLTAALFINDSLPNDAATLDRVKTLLPPLSDSGLVRFLNELAGRRFNDPRRTRHDLDIGIAECHQMLAIGKRISSPRIRTEIYINVSAGFFINHDTATGKAVWQEGWPFARAANNIERETDYFFWLVFYAGRSPSTDSTSISAMRQLSADALRLLRPSDPPSLFKKVFYYFTGTGNQYFIQGRPSMAIVTEEEAAGLNRRLHQTWASPEATLASMYQRLGDMDKALQHGLEAVRVSESRGLPPVEANGYNSLGQIYLWLGDLDKSRDYYEKAIPILLADNKAVNDAPAICKRLAGIYIQFGRLQDALRLMDTAAKTCLLARPRDREMIAMGYGDCYFAMRQYEKAERYYLTVFDSASQLNISDRLLITTAVARLYNATGRYSKAQPLLSFATADSNRIASDLNSRKDAFFLAYQADSALGNFRTAITHLRQYQQLNDSLSSQAKNRQLREATTRYETGKKDQNIARLNAEARLREADLKQSRLLRNGLIAGSVLLILLLAVIFNRYRLKQRSNTLLQARQLELDESNHRLVELNGRQQRLLDEKEWLMREIHHRVKNNLQLVISLLNMQSSTLKDELAVNAFGDIRSRIRAISLIHQRLYQEGQDIMRIAMPEYVDELAGFLEDSFNLRQRIRFETDIDAVDLDVAQCVPIGLILNEAVTNAIKYAFPPAADRADANAGACQTVTDTNAFTRNGYPTITIALKREADNQLRLLVADNGIGLPAGFEPAGSGSMGLQLIRILSTQLEGCLQITSRPGVHISVLFPPDPRYPKSDNHHRRQPNSASAV